MFINNFINIMNLQNMMTKQTRSKKSSINPATLEFDRNSFYNKKSCYDSQPNSKLKYCNNNYEDAQYHRKNIKQLLLRIMSKYNCTDIKQLTNNIDRLEYINLQKITKLQSQLQKNYGLQLMVGDIQEIVNVCNNMILDILQDYNDQRIQKFYQRFLMIVKKFERQSKDEDNEQQCNNSKTRRINRRLRQEQKRRKQVQQNMNYLFEGSKQSIIKKQLRIKDLQGQNNKIRMMVNTLKSEIENKQRTLRECMSTVTHLKESLLSIKQDSGRMRPFAQIRSDVNIVNKLSESISDVVYKTLQENMDRNERKHKKKNEELNKQQIEKLNYEMLLMQALTIEQFIQRT